jgi:hypothetical protein
MGLEVDSKALQSSQMVAKARACFQVDQTALELNKVLCGLSCPLIQTLANLMNRRPIQNGVLKGGWGVGGTKNPSRTEFAILSAASKTSPGTGLTRDWMEPSLGFDPAP